MGERTQMGSNEHHEAAFLTSCEPQEPSESHTSTFEHVFQLQPEILFSAVMTRTRMAFLVRDF